MLQVGLLNFMHEANVRQHKNYAAGDFPKKNCNSMMVFLAARIGLEVYYLG